MLDYLGPHFLLLQRRANSKSGVDRVTRKIMGVHVHGINSLRSRCLLHDDWIFGNLHNAEHDVESKGKD